MGTVNAERCRRTIVRSRVASAEATNRRRLAAMSPEHRAKHERWPLGICMECLTVNWPRTFGSTRAVASAAEAEATVTRGLAAGLTEAECREVVAVWTDYHRVRFAVLDWPMVGQAMTLRAMGEEWRPDKLGEARLLRLLGRTP